ncbi:ABC transporter ATP-binding protein/permease [Fulvivirga maritima]|uniref:peptidase domain-containing ABC transporter n=1 Tax=Fulvivirga maritima TaxID=2904247 RepID=UPI001F467D5C|nr:ABC transporter ATP-binding protein [Fulvivirga maritima]UII25441.1 ABC transporter ATP-binding protein/permease [Fulvivirga maritima]
MKENTSTLTPTQRFWRLLKPDRKEIKNVYLYSIFNGLVSLSLPLGIQAIVNFIQGGQISTSWVVLVFLVVLGIAVSGVLQIYQLRITENLQQKIFSRAAFEFAYRMPRTKMESLYKHYAPELMNRFFDIISVQKGLSKILIDFSVALLNVVFGLLLLSFYHSFFILFSVILVILVVVIIRFTGKKGMATSLKESKYKYKVAYWLEELARTNTTFKLVGNTDLPLEKVDTHVSNYLESRENHFKILVQQYSLMVVFKVLVATGLLAIGGVLVMEQQMNIGQFIAAEIIILTVMVAVEKLIRSLETIYDVLTSLEKIAQVTDMELEKTEGVDFTKEVNGNGLSLDLEKVTFAYPDQQNPVLQDVNLSIESGERVVISGDNNSGKRTLLYVIAGLYKVQKGTIAYQGLPIGNLNISSLRTVFGDYLSQEQLFEGTVMENITMGRKNVSFEEVKWAIKNLNLEEFIKGLSKGYDTELDAQGNKLPGSIAQKLLLARSIVGNPKLLILEDLYMHLDEEEYRRVIDFLIDKSHPWTLVAISSEYYFTSKSDKVIIMENGKVSKSGKYTELKSFLNLKNNGHA